MARIRLPAAVAVFTVAAFFAATGNWPWRRIVTAPDVVTAAPAAPRPTHTEFADTLGRGETISELFARNGVQGIDLAALAGAVDPRRLRAGLVVNVRRPLADSTPDRIVVRTGSREKTTS